MAKQIRTIEMTNAQRSILSYLSEVEESVTDLIRFANMRRSEVLPRRSLTVWWQLLWRGSLPFVTPHQNWDALREKRKPEGA